jgi:glycerol-3-phosphate acyltransferase PlsY
VEPLRIAVLVIASYLLGSVPFGLWVCRALKGVDIRTLGSGNIGATNVWRTVGPAPGLLVLVLDVLKGWGPAFAGTTLGGPVYGVVGGAAAVLGHSFSPFLRFRGGKGVATTLGVLIGVTPVTAAITFGAWIVVLALSRYVSLASILASAVGVATVAVRREDPIVLALFALIGLLIIVRHRGNIARMAKGEEPKFRFRAGGDGGDPKA